MNNIVVLITLYAITVMVSIPFSYVYANGENYIEKVQHTKMVLNSKSLASSLVLSFIMVFSLWYCIIERNGGGLEAFLLGIVMTAYSEFTTSLMFTEWPLKIVFIDILVGGTIFSLVTIIYNLIFKRLELLLVRL
jgi:glucan phosphoethanolaminetransferase (alkaline phosphatase superfamily)